MAQQVVVIEPDYFSVSVTAPQTVTVSNTGPQGPQGATGATGPTGPQGPSGVISVNSPVTNSGSSTSAALGLDSTIVPYKASANVFTNVQQITTPSAATKGLIVQGAASQTANLQEWQDSSGNIVFGVTAGGALRFIAATSIANTGSYIATNIVTDSVTVLQRAAAVTALIVKGAASQTADLQQWQNSAGTVLTKVNSLGYVLAPGIGPSSGVGYLYFQSTGPIFTDGSASVVTLRVKGAASQTANLQEWQDSAGTVLLKVSSTGNIITTQTAYFSGVSNPSTSNNSFIEMLAAGTRISVGVATNVPLTVKGAASQTADLQQWQNSSGTALAKITSAGGLIGDSINTINAYARLREENAGGNLQLTKSTAAATNPGAGIARVYFRDGTNAGTLKLVVRAGAAGAETTILDNIPQ